MTRRYETPTLNRFWVCPVCERKDEQGHADWCPTVEQLLAARIAAVSFKADSEAGVPVRRNMIHKVAERIGVPGEWLARQVEHLITDY